MNFSFEILKNKELELRGQKLQALETKVKSLDLSINDLENKYAIAEDGRVKALDELDDKKREVKNCNSEIEHNSK